MWQPGAVLVYQVWFGYNVIQPFSVYITLLVKIFEVLMFYKQVLKNKRALNNWIPRQDHSLHEHLIIYLLLTFANGIITWNFMTVCDLLLCWDTRSVQLNSRYEKDKSSSPLLARNFLHPCFRKIFSQTVHKGLFLPHVLLSVHLIELAQIRC